MSFLEELPDNVEHADLLGKIQDINEPQLLRLAYEYLPFSFSRRHGDPSRPWNKFAIQVSDDDGNGPALMRGTGEISFRTGRLCAVVFLDLFRVSSLSLLMQQPLTVLIRIVFHEPVSTGKALLTMILGRISDIGGTIRLPTCWRS